MCKFDQKPTPSSPPDCQRHRERTLREQLAEATNEQERAELQAQVDALPAGADHAQVVRCSACTSYEQKQARAMLLTGNREEVWALTDKRGRIGCGDNSHLGFEEYGCKNLADCHEKNKDNVTPVYVMMCPCCDQAGQHGNACMHINCVEQGRAGVYRVLQT